MKAASVSEIKKELKTKSNEQLLELTLRLSKFKKENKELLTYLLFESDNEQAYIRSIKLEITEHFQSMNTLNYYWMKKSVRKILRIIAKYCRYSKKPTTEIDLLIFFCQEMNDFEPSIYRSSILKGIFVKQVEKIEKLVSKLHEDYQLDYEDEIEALKSKL